MPVSRPRTRLDGDTGAAADVFPAGRPHGGNVGGEEVMEVGAAAVERVEVVCEGDGEGAAADPGREVGAGLLQVADAVGEGDCDGGGEVDEDGGG